MIIKKIKNTAQFENFYLFFILLIGFVSFTWFRNDLIVSGGDSPFNFYPQVNSEYYYSTWNKLSSLGEVNTQALPHIFRHYFYLLFSLVGLPLWLAQRILYYFLFVSGGIGTYLIAKRLLNLEPIFCLWSGLFYMFNLFSLVFVWGIPGVLMFAYAALPVLFYLLSTLLKKKTFKNVLTFCLAGFIFSSFCGNFSFVFILWGFLFFYFIYDVAINKEDRLNKILFFLILIFFWLLTNLYWFLPFFSSINRLAESAIYLDTVEVFKGSTAKAFLPNSFRLMGYPVFFEKFMGIDSYFNYSQAYNSPFLVILTFLPPIIVFSSILFYKKNQPLFWFFWIVLLVSVYVYKGAQGPFGNIFLLPMEEIPFLAFLRNPLDKIGTLVVFSFSLLSALFLNGIKKIFKKKIYFNILLASLFIGVIGLAVFPFWRRQIYPPKGEIRPSPLTKMPDYYYELADWLKSQEEEFRILAIPINNIFGVPYKWEYGHGGADPVAFVLPKPLVYFDSKLVDITWNCLNLPQNEDNQDKGKNCLKKALGLLNVKYLLVHKDIEEKYFNVDENEVSLMRSKLESRYFSGIEFVRSFGEVDVYVLADEYYLPRFYFPKEEIYIDAKEDLWKTYLRQEGVPDLFFTSSHLNNSGLTLSEFEKRGVSEEEVLLEEGKDLKVKIFKANIDEEISEVEIKSKGPGYYLLSTSLNTPRFLVFSSNYDDQWGAFVNGKKLSHYLVNGYANGWWLEDTGDRLDIEIKYRPQQFYWLGVSFSLLGYLILIVLTLHESRKRN